MSYWKIAGPAAGAADEGVSRAGIVAVRAEPSPRHAHREWRPGSEWGTGAVARDGIRVGEQTTTRLDALGKGVS